jgi:hypothetical protein
MSKGITVAFIFLKVQYYTSIPMEGLKKTAIRLTHKIWPADRELNLRSLEYEGLCIYKYQWTELLAP